MNLKDIQAQRLTKLNRKERRLHEKKTGEKIVAGNVPIIRNTPKKKKFSLFGNK